MALEFLVAAGALHRGVAAGARERELHGAVEQLEALDVVDGLLGAVGVGEDDEGLALGLEVGLGYDVDDLAILGEELLQGLGELGDLDRLLEVADVDARMVSVNGRTCRSAMTRTWRSVGGYLQLEEQTFWELGSGRLWWGVWRCL